MLHCIFCNLPKKRIIRESKYFIVTRDIYPISENHTLIISKRHIRFFEDLSLNERQELIELIFSIQQNLKKKFCYQDFNIGINDGENAGQTIPHFHLHIIPRIQGDVDDPKGGIRWVIPSKANYWSNNE